MLSEKDDKDDTPEAGKHKSAKRDERDDDDEGAQPVTAIVVTARRLDAARMKIAADLGATAYTLDNETIEDRPGGETGSIGKILTQTPGVTLSGGGLIIRGANAVRVRINNVVVPEAISDPADRLSSRLAQTTRVITGTLPAQFGFAPGGVVSVTTKNGLYQHGGQAELFAGNHGMVEPALEWASSIGSTSLFGSGSFEAGRSSVADLSGASTTDRRREFGGLAFGDNLLDQENRVSMILGGSSERNTFGPTSLAAGRELDRSGFAMGTLQHSTPDFTLQASLFAGLSSANADFATWQHTRGSSLGTQIDSSYRLDDANTLRAGLLMNQETFRLASAGPPASRARRTSIGVYLQDQFKLSPRLEFNAGMRADWLHGLSSGINFEPRMSIVWMAPEGFSLHAGYARYAAAFPLGEADGSLPTPDESDDYFGAGIQQEIGPLTLGIDGYWRTARNLIVEHRTIGQAEPTAFAFRRGKFRGIELSATYAEGGIDAWANVSFSGSHGRGIVGGETLFPQSVIDNAGRQWIPLASDRPISGSAGLTWHLDKVDLGADVVAASGVVASSAGGVPNGTRTSAYASLGLSAVYHMRILDMPADVRADLINLSNVQYLTNDAANLEGGWNRRDPGRAFMIGIEQGFGARAEH